MYIPLHPLPFTPSAAAGAAARPQQHRPAGAAPATGRARAPFFHAIPALLGGRAGTNPPARHQSGANGDQNTNATIGAVVGVVLALFIVGAFAFVWTYRHSIRFSSKKHRRRSRRKSSASKTSKSSSESGGPPAPPPAAPPPAEAPPEEAPAAA